MAVSKRDVLKAARANKKKTSRVTPVVSPVRELEEDESENSGAKVRTKNSRGGRRVKVKAPTAEVTAEDVDGTSSAGDHQSQGASDGSE